MTLNTKVSPHVGNILGASRAETDSEMLAAAFVETTDYHALAYTRDFNYVVGRRGTGKSALFQKIKEFFVHDPNMCLVASAPREHETLEIQTVLKELGADYRSARAITRLAWKIDTLLTVAESTRHHRLQRSPEHAYIQTYKESQGTLLQNSAGAKRCAAIIKACRQGAASLSEVPGCIAVDLRMNWLEENVRSILTATSHSAIVLWDGLDEGWVPDEVATAVLGGLAAAVSDLADSKTGVHGVLFIRDNMFRALAHFDGDFSRHIDGSTLRLNWDQHSLLHLIANRLRVALNLQDIESDIRVWNRFAERGLRDREGFEFCLRHTLYRPRDILVLLNKAYVTAARAGRHQLVEDDIEVTGRGVSSDRLDDLLKEYHAVLPGLSLFVRAFEDKRAFEQYQSVVELLSETIGAEHYESSAASDFALFNSGQEVFLALYSVGFLGIKDPVGNRYHFCHDGSLANLAEIDDGRIVAVHPCYWRALNLTSVGDEPGSGIVIDTDDEFEDGGVVPELASRMAHVRDLRTQRLGQVLEELPRISLGQPGYSNFEEWVLRALRMLFPGRLSNFQLKPNAGNVQQRDIVATNNAEGGFWRRVLEDYDTRQVVFEIKNYAELGRDDFRQILSYTSGPYGKFGVLVDRSENEGMTERERTWVQEMWHEHKRLVFTLPISLIRRSISKLRTLRKHDYTETALSKRLDTFQRSYIPIKHPR